MQTICDRLYLKPEESMKDFIREAHSYVRGYLSQTISMEEEPLVRSGNQFNSW